MEQKTLKLANRKNKVIENNEYEITNKIIQEIKNTIFDNNYKIMVAYTNETETVSFVLANEDVENNRIYKVKIDSEGRKVEKLQITRFIQDDNFDFFSKGYDPVYISYEHHYSLWNYIHDVAPLVKNKEGMLAYIDFCKEIELTRNEIEKNVGSKLKGDILKEWEQLIEKSEDNEMENKNDKEINITISQLHEQIAELKEDEMLVIDLSGKGENDDR